MVVKGKAVELDDQPLFGPERIDLISEDLSVGRGWRQEMSSTEGSKAILERGAGCDRSMRFDQESTDRLQRSTAVALFADRLHLAQAQEFEPVGLLPSPLEATLIDGLGEVEEGSGNGGDRNAVQLPCFAGTEPRSMQADAAPAPAAMGTGHVRRFRRPC